ncbi:MAG: hypothetical protein ACJAZQ_002984 [Cognaticolwellia sp.]|jgi:hypothetical protein
MTPLDVIPGAILKTDVGDSLSFKGSKSNDPLFDQLTNTLVFLQSFDEDSNLDNDINIPEGIAALLTDVNIDFNDDIYSFNDTIKRITNQAANAGILNSGGVRKPGYALDHF